MHILPMPIFRFLGNEWGCPSPQKIIIDKHFDNYFATVVMIHRLYMHSGQCEAINIPEISKTSLVE